MADSQASPVSSEKPIQVVSEVISVEEISNEVKEITIEADSWPGSQQVEASSKSDEAEDGEDKKDQKSDSDSDEETDDEAMKNFMSNDKSKYGKRCRAHNVYEAPREDYCLDSPPTWQDEMPAGVRKSAESEPRWRKYALLMRNTMYSGTLKRHSMVIHSPHLRKHLVRILEGYAGLALEREILEIPAPFEPLFFHWDDLKQVAAGQVPEGADAPTELEQQHMQLLVDTLEPEFVTAWEARKNYTETGKVDFDHLWTLFPARTIVISSSGPRTETSYILRNTERFLSKRDGQVYFILRAYVVSFDGYRFGMKANPLAVAQYIGVRSLVELDICPLDLHPNRVALRERLIARGKRFEELTKMTYATYEGPGVECIDTNYQKAKVFAVSGRVIVDVEAFVKFNPGLEPNLLPLDFLDIAWDPRLANFKDSDGYNNNYYPDDKERAPEAAISELRAPSASVNGRVRRRPLPPLTEAQQLICDHALQAYSMSLKRWLMIKIDFVRPVVWNDRAFNSLSLPNDQKKVLLSFARSQALSQSNVPRWDSDLVSKEEREGFDTLPNPEDGDYSPFDDVISGKGKGFVVLLEGPPGVGKTLTVESIAEEMRVPLYSVGAGELGSYSGQVETNLERVLDMAAMWNAVVLLDEADIFLEKRTTTQMDRNQIVAIFLRLLEYFEGTIFLTTNRVDSIDPAFESRIHLWLPYVPLESANRVDIWNTALQGVRLALDKDLAVVHEKKTPAVINKLAEVKLNGRQIKNVVKMASLLAASQSGVMLPEHLEEIMEIWRPRLDRTAEEWDKKVSA